VHLRRWVLIVGPNVRKYQEASSLTEYDLMMVPHLLTMRMRSRTLEESPVQNLGRNEGVSMHGTSKGVGRPTPTVDAQKALKEKCAKPSLTN
jgi:hypothetical protein